MRQNKGVIIEEPKPEDYVVGANSPLVSGIVFPDGHGIMDYIKFGEFQKKAFESMGCVSMSANHNTQIVKAINFGIDENESDRFTIVGSGTTEKGNTLNNVAQFKKNKSFVLEDQYPWPADMDRKTFFQTISDALYKLAEKNGDIWEYKHEWVITSHDNLIDRLKRGQPIQATITDWKERDGINYSVGSDQIHAINIVDREDGKYWWVYDQYDDDFIYDENFDKNKFLKKFDWNFPFGYFGKVYTVNKIGAQKVSIITKIKNMINDIWVWFETSGSPKGLRAYYVPKDSKGNPKGKQELGFENLDQIIITLKALFAAIFASGLFKKTNWPEVKNLEDKNFI